MPLLKVVHGHYAQRVNRMRDLKGHLWQGRYFSSALDADYFANAVRYVELNPLRTGLVQKAEEYPWSSAAAHCGLRTDPLVTTRRCDSTVLAGISDWSSWLAAGVSADRCEVLRRHARQNRPCGAQTFVDQVERQAGGPLRHKPAGRHVKPRTKTRRNDTGTEIGERPLLEEGTAEVAAIRQHCSQYVELVGSEEAKEHLNKVYQGVRLLSTRRYSFHKGSVIQCLASTSRL